MDSMFEFISGVAFILDIILSVLGLPVAVVIDLGGKINTNLFVKYIKLMGILFLIGIIALLIGIIVHIFSIL